MRGQEGQHRRRHLGPHPGQAHQDLGLGEGGEEGLDSGFHLPQEPLHAGQLPLEENEDLRAPRPAGRLQLVEDGPFPLGQVLPVAHQGLELLEGFWGEGVGLEAFPTDLGVAGEEEGVLAVGLVALPRGPAEGGQVVGVDQGYLEALLGQELEEGEVVGGSCKELCVGVCV